MTDTALIAANGKADRLITAIAEGEVELEVHEILILILILIMMLELFEVFEELEALEERRCSRVREGLERTTGPRKGPCKGSTSTPGQNRGPAPLARIEDQHPWPESRGMDTARSNKLTGKQANPNIIMIYYDEQAQADNTNSVKTPRAEEPGEDEHDGNRSSSESRLSLIHI